MSKQGKKVVKVGLHEVSFGIATVARVEQRTGVPAGKLIADIRRKQVAIQGAREGGVDKDEVGCITLEAIGNITLAMNFVGAALNVHNDIVEADHGDNLIKVFGDLFPAFADAVVRMTGVDPESDSDDESEGDEGNASTGDGSSTGSPESQSQQA